MKFSMIACLLLLLVVGTARAATLSGDVTCEGCGPVAVRLVLGSSPFGPPLYTVTLDAPGPWSIVVGDGAGLVGAYAFEDLDEDGEPDPGAALTAYASNPIDVGSADITGIHLTATPAAAPTVNVAGTVTCPGCDVVRVRLSSNDTPALAFVDVELAGAVPAGGIPWSVAVPRDLGPVWVFVAAYADTAIDAWVAFPGNPITIGESDVTGVDLVLEAPHDVVLSGTIVCPSCTGGVGLDVRMDGALGPLVLGELLAAPGVFALSLPQDFGPVALVAFRDDDGDGVADLGAPLGAYARNPVMVERDDIGGLTLVLPEASGAAVQLSGTLACADCVGAGVTLRVGGALGPELVATALVSGSGAWSLRVPARLGQVGLLAFRDDDQDGLPDGDQPLGEYAQNPVDVGVQDVTGLALSVPAKVVTAVKLSGTVVCADCTGGVGARVHLGSAEGQVFALAALGGPGPFEIELPLDVGEVALVAFRDDDFDGLPDVGAIEAEYADNPLTIGSSDVSGVTLTLPPGGAATVTISGRVACSDCAAGVGVVAVGDDGATFARIHLAEPGPFTFALGRDAGSIALSAYRDDDGDLLPDTDAGLVAYPDNPISIGTEPIVGVVFDLTPGGVGDPGPEEEPDGGPEAGPESAVEEVSDAADAADAIEEVDAADGTEEVDAADGTEEVDAADGTEEVADDADATEVLDVDATEVLDADADEIDADVTAEPTIDAGADEADKPTDQGGCGCSAGGGSEAAVWAALALLARAASHPRKRSRPARGGAPR